MARWSEALRRKELKLLPGQLELLAMADAESHPPARKILVAVDESEGSLFALSWALDNLILPRPLPEGAKCSDLIVLLHVQTHPQAFVGAAGPGFYTTPEILESVKKHQDDISKRVLAGAKAICDERRLDAETMVTVGDPRDAICEAVGTLQPSFLVVGSHGYGALKRALLGSVSDYCAHHAKCPVFIVKKP